MSETTTFNTDFKLNRSRSKTNLIWMNIYPTVPTQEKLDQIILRTQSKFIKIFYPGFTLNILLTVDQSGVFPIWRYHHLLFLWKWKRLNFDEVPRHSALVVFGEDAGPRNVFGPNLVCFFRKTEKKVRVWVWKKANPKKTEKKVNGKKNEFFHN